MEIKNTYQSLYQLWVQALGTVCRNRNRKSRSMQYKSGDHQISAVETKDDAAVGTELIVQQQRNRLDGKVLPHAVLDGVGVVDQDTTALAMAAQTSGNQ